MPELPEVETISKQLNSTIKGKTISDVLLLLRKISKKSENELIKRIKKAKIEKCYRRAKLVCVELSNGFTIIFHLKLSGQIFFVKDNKKPQKHVHLIITFSDKTRLFFREVRQFGYVDVLDQNELKELFSHFGPEPLEKNFTFQFFTERLKKRRKSKIKPLLQDQKFIAGIGNIYANEALFMSKIHPERMAGSLRESEAKELYENLKKVLALSIKHHGCSDTDYLDIFGEEGTFENCLLVYRKQGEICPKCKEKKIKRIVVASRGTFYCPKCQNYYHRPISKANKNILSWKKSSKP